MPVVRLDGLLGLDVPRRRNALCAFNYIIYPIFVQCYVMGHFGHENGPFWSCFFRHWGRFGQGRFGLRGPFSTFIGAVLAMGRFGRFPSKTRHKVNRKKHIFGNPMLHANLRIENGCK